MSIFAVDFDRTLALGDSWPDCSHSKPNMKLIHYLALARSHGHKVILWTMREGQMLDEAVFWCMDLGIVFDAINDNLPEMQEVYGNNPRKVYADYYIDDHNGLCGIGKKVPVLKGVKR